MVTKRGIQYPQPVPCPFTARFWTHSAVWTYFTFFFSFTCWYIFLPLTSDSISSDALSGLWFSNLHVSMLKQCLFIHTRLPVPVSAIHTLTFYVWVLQELVPVPTCRPSDIFPVFLLFWIDCSDLAGHDCSDSWGFLPTKASHNGIVSRWALKLKPIPSLLKSGL